MSRVFVYDMNLRAIDELTCRSQWVSALNTPDGSLGTATIFLSLKDEKLDAELLEFGNIVVIQPGMGLPLWCGEIGEPQSADQFEVSIGATAIEILLDDRVVSGRLEDGSAGAMFRDIIREASAATQAPMIIKEGDIQEGGGSVPSIGGRRAALAYIQALQERYGGEWGVSCLMGEYQIPKLEAFYLEQVGVDYSGDVALIEGTNIRLAEGPIWTRTGRVKNDATVIGHGGKDNTTVIGQDTNDTSIARYGVRQMVVSENLRSQASVDKRARHLALSNGQPARRFEVTANNSEIYPYLRLGNTLALDLPSQWDVEKKKLGIQTSVRIVGLAFDDMEGEVPLTVEEVTE